MVLSFRNKVICGIRRNIFGSADEMSRDTERNVGTLQVKQEPDETLIFLFNIL